MKALSLKQPFAQLVVSGKKTIELRNWNTHFRGKFLIHASKKPDKFAMENFGFSKLPLGKIVGSSVLVDVRRYENEKEHSKDKEKHLANSFWGKYGFVLEDSSRFDGPFTNGKLNFWNFEGDLE